MSDLVGNHIVGFPTRWLIYSNVNNKWNLNFNNVIISFVTIQFNMIKDARHANMFICRFHCNDYATWQNER